MKPTELPKIFPARASGDVRFAMAELLTDLQANATANGGKTIRALNIKVFLEAALAKVAALTPAGVPATLTVSSATASANGRSVTVVFNQPVNPDTVFSASDAFAAVLGRKLGDATIVSGTTVRYDLKAPYLVTGDTLSLTFRAAYLPKSWGAVTCSTTSPIVVNVAGVTNTVSGV
jgi:hypothetical protein